MTGTRRPPRQIINVGLSSFADAILHAGGMALHVDWRPPAEGDTALGKSLANLVNNPTVDQANQTAFNRYLNAQPQLESVGAAGALLPGMEDRMILHSGPPIEWQNMCGPMQGAIIGAAIFEGWAEDQNSAVRLLESGEVSLEPCHHHGAAGPMSGIISPSMPVWKVHNSDLGNHTFSNLNEGLGKVLRFGANSPDVIERLKWMQQTLAIVLNEALDELGPVELKPLMAQALHMGDEIHNRNAAATSLFIKKLIPAALRSAQDLESLSQAIEFMAGNDHFFLNLSMAACKSMLDAAHGVPHSSMVTAMARNGVDFGIRLSGCGGDWFTTPAPVVNGLYFPGYTIDDSAPDLGDSAITETAGIGGFAMAAAPAIVQFVGGTPADALACSKEMTYITLGRNHAFTLPVLNFVGTAAGIDARKVVDTGIAPIINTGIAHRDAGIGQIGAGITRAPLKCFSQAIDRLGETIES